MGELKKGIESNPVLDRLPRHLLQYVKPQNYEAYTSVDHAVWRYVMRKNVQWLKEVAHETYLEGLTKTGISIDQIPSMYGMNRILQKIGWAAVAVDGLIPTRAFLEFQAYNVLVIASEIRTLADIEYTPIPDIIHESAGHAPIIANPEYAEFLRRLGQIGAKAVASHWDQKLEVAVRRLTELKENAEVSAEMLKSAHEHLEQVQSEVKEHSEMTAIRNLHWWSVEYGLIGDPAHHKIYGAGLLSSIGESKWCLSDQVKKLPYSLEASKVSFDYTKPQPQLFVTPDFAHLSYVLEKYANTMAIRAGGLRAVEKLINSRDLGTLELSTGIQISGIFSRVLTNRRGEVSFFQTTGPTALAYREKEMVGHGRDHYSDGFCSPVGKLEGINLAIEDMSPRDLDAYNIYEGRVVELNFEGDISLRGTVVTGIRNLYGKIILIKFDHCTVRYRNEELFSPDQGVYHMVVGKEVRSGFAGPADLQSFDLVTHEVSEKTPVVPPPTEREKAYQTVWDFKHNSGGAWEKIANEVLTNFSEDWLLQVELLQQTYRIKGQDQELAKRIKKQLNHLAKKYSDKAHLIKDGLSLLNSSRGPANA